jgi:hypothetical protein
LSTKYNAVLQTLDFFYKGVHQTGLQDVAESYRVSYQNYEIKIMGKCHEIEICPSEIRGFGLE